MVRRLGRIIVIVAVAASVFIGFMAYSYVTRSFYFAERILNLGESSLDYLRGQPYSRLVVEVDHVRGRQPSQYALDVLRERILMYTDKKEVIFDLSEELPEGNGNYSIQDLIDLYLKHRDHRTEGNSAAMYILYVDGKAAGSERWGGVAYTSRSFAVFRDLFAEPFSEPKVGYSPEAIILVHEMGHLLGLVNLAYKSDQTTLHGSSIPYEDKDHPSHTRNTSDVMYFKSESPEQGAQPPSDFGYETAHDLEGLKSGRLPVVPPGYGPLWASAPTDIIMVWDGVCAVGQPRWPQVSS